MTARKFTTNCLIKQIGSEEKLDQEAWGKGLLFFYYDLLYSDFIHTRTYILDNYIKQNQNQSYLTPLIVELGLDRVWSRVWAVQLRGLIQYISFRFRPCLGMDGEQEVQHRPAVVLLSGPCCRGMDARQVNLMRVKSIIKCNFIRCFHVLGMAWRNGAVLAKLEYQRRNSSGRGGGHFSLSQPSKKSHFGKKSLHFMLAAYAGVKEKCNSLQLVSPEIDILFLLVTLTICSQMQVCMSWGDLFKMQIRGAPSKEILMLQVLSSIQESVVIPMCSQLWEPLF